MAEWVSVARVTEFPENTRRTLAIDDVSIAVFNLAGRYYAIENTCTHDFVSLDEAAIEGCEIICPRHAARFNIMTGAALTPPAYENLATFPVRIDGEWVQVRDDRWDK